MCKSEVPFSPEANSLQKCGRQFHQDVHQQIANLDPLRAMIEDIVLHAKRQLHQGTFPPLKSLKGTCTKSLKCSDGNATQTSHPATAPQGEPSSSGPGSNSNVPNENNQDAGNLSGLRHRKAQRVEQNDRDEADEIVVKKWIIIGLPNKKYKTLEYIGVNKFRGDLSIFSRDEEPVQKTS